MKKLLARLTTLSMTAGLLVLPALASGVQRLSQSLTVSSKSNSVGRQNGNQACKPVYKPKKTCNTSLTVSVSTTSVPD
jgi:hypothetical protein